MVKLKIQNAMARTGAATRKPNSLSSGCAAMLLRRQAFDTRMSWSLGRKVNSTPTEIDRLTSEHCLGLKPKASAKTTGKASGKT